WCFFQAEDGIRDRNVTGVQTCALPISYLRALKMFAPERMSGMKELLKKWGYIVANPKSRWATIFIWILLIGVVSYIWSQVNDWVTTDQQLMPDDVMSVDAITLINEEFKDAAGTPLLLVWHRDGGLKDSDYAMIQALYKELYEDPVSEQTFIPPFQEIPVEALAGSS